MRLQESMIACRTLMKEVSANKSNIEKYKEQQNAVNGFFIAYESYYRNAITALKVIISDCKDLIIGQTTLDAYRECSIIVKSAFEKKQVEKASTFRKSAEFFNDQLQGLWEKYSVEQTKKPKASLGILRLVCDKKDIFELFSKLDNYEEWPITEKKQEDFKLACKSITNMQKDLHFDPDIEHFLNKVRDGNATLQDLTSDVMKWLQSEELMEKISLGVR